MKRSLLVVMLVFASQMAPAQTHIMDQAVRGLVKAGDELKEVNRKPGYVADMDADVEQIKNQVSSLTFQALLMPVKIADAKLSRLGYDIKWTNDLHFQYEYSENAKAKQLAEEALDLKAKNFEELAASLQSHLEMARSVNRSVTMDEYVHNLSQKQKAELAATFDTSRFNILKDIQSYANEALDCIRYFSPLVLESGLNAMHSATGEFQWSPVSLQEKYGVLRIKDLSKTHKRSVVKLLEEMLNKSHDTNYTCISIKKGTFFRTELESLKKDLGI